MLPADTHYVGVDFWSSEHCKTVKPDNEASLQFVDNGHEAILAAVRFGEFCNEHDVLLVANLDTEHEQSIELDLGPLDLPLPLQLHNMLEEDHLELTDPGLHLSLAPCGVKAFELRCAP